MEKVDLLFYTDILRTFRSTLVGYLYQVCQHRRVVLLGEALDAETERLLGDPAFFPGLVGRAHVGQYDPGQVRWRRHRRMAKLAQEVVDRWRPKTVFAAGTNLFEHYLRRQARVVGARTVGCLGLLLVDDPRDVPLLLDLHAAEARLPSWVPRKARRGAVRLRRRMAQAYEYLLLPMLAGQRPFPGGNGIYRLDYTRLEGMDTGFVFTRRNQAMLVQAGVPVERVPVVPHPLLPGMADPVWRAYGLSTVLAVPRPRVVTCFLDVEPNWGFHRDDLRPIPDETLVASRLRVVKALMQTLPGWEIRVKPHPMSERSPLYPSVMTRLRALGQAVVLVPPAEPADRHIGQSGAIIGFPPASTALYTGILQCPGLPAIQVDINAELRGDAYQNMPGVVTATSLEGLCEYLAILREGRWPDRPYRPDPGDFESFDVLVEAMVSSPADHFG